jgi:hypothetical protein
MSDVPKTAIRALVHYALGWNSTTARILNTTTGP